MAQTTKAPGSPTPAVYALTLGSQADALGLTGTQFAAPTATKNGVSIAITGYAWTVTGPCTLDDDAIAQPTPTHTGAGIVTRQLTATLADGAVVASAMDGWRVGTTTGWVRVKLFLPSSMADGDWNAIDPITYDGVSITSPNTAAIKRILSGVWTVDTTVGTNPFTIFPISQTMPSAISGRTKHLTIAMVMGVDASVTADSDFFQLIYMKSGGSKNTSVFAQRVAGVQKIGVGDSAGTTYRNTSGGLQARQICMMLGPQRLSQRGLYTASAWSGNGLAPDDADWTIAAGTPSGWWQPENDVTDAATDDVYAPDTAESDYAGFCLGGANGRAYTIAGISVWVHGA